MNMIMNTILLPDILRMCRLAVFKGTAVMFAMLLACSAGAYAEKVKVNTLYFNLNSEDNTAEVAPGEEDGTYVSGALTIPSTVAYNGVQYAVTGIGNDAFSFCTGIMSVTIPQSILRIGDYAFAGCTKLSTVTFRFSKLA